MERIKKIKCACGKERELPTAVCWYCEVRLCPKCKEHSVDKDNIAISVCNKCKVKYEK